MRKVLFFIGMFLFFGGLVFMLTGIFFPKVLTMTTTLYKATVLFVVGTYLVSNNKPEHE
jgi:hypothetical protein